MIPVYDAPIENGRVTVSDGRIASVAKAGTPREDEIDLGDVALLPGLINAHTHLSLSYLHEKIPFDGSFTDWIERLVGLRREAADSSIEDESLREGLELSRQAGVVAVCDIAYDTRAVERWRETGIHTFGCLETLGMFTSAGDDPLASIESLVTTTPPTGANAGQHAQLSCVGVSPHAPYSTSPELYRRAIAMAGRTGCLLTTHLAETREERQFLRDGTGPFRRLLEKWNLWDGSFEPPGCSPVRYADELGLLAVRPLLAHVNHVDDEELELLHHSRSHVVYCPRTHAFFGHDPHRYPEMFACGINVCIGTDSLASNTSLSVLDEIRFLRANGSPLTDHALLEMATIHGARALRCEHELGTLYPGKRAELIAVPLDHASTNDPLADLLRSEQPVHVV